MNYYHNSIKKRLHKKTAILVLFVSSLSSPLFFYYLFDLEIPFPIVSSLYAAWIVSFGFDMGITLQNRHLIKSHESNIIFQNLYAKFNIVTSVLIQICVETSFVFLMPFLFDKNNFTIDVQASSLIAVMICTLHFTAWHHNKKTIKEIMNRKKINPKYTTSKDIYKI